VSGRSRRGALLVFGTAAAVVALDQITKALAVDRLQDAPVELIPGLLTLRYTTNTGGAFSLFTDAPWFFAAASAVVITAIAVAAFLARPAWQAVALGAVLGGAIGNLADRIARGSGVSGRVVDFIDPHVWPVFNLADASIVLGALGLAIGSIVHDRREHAASSGIDDAA
jgi:signal peptidase II